MCIQDRKNALASFLDVERSTIKELHNLNRFDCILGSGDNEFLVLREDEANTLAKENIESSVWAFYAQFLVNYMPEEFNVDIVEKIQELHEDGNEALVAIIKSNGQWDRFVDDAIRYDGIGHFNSPVDGTAHEEDDFFIFRV